jgi:hypothetical protein
MNSKLVVINDLYNYLIKLPKFVATNEKFRNASKMKINEIINDIFDLSILDNKKVNELKDTFIKYDKFLINLKSRPDYRSTEKNIIIII